MSRKSHDRIFMQRCIELAKKGSGKVSPNPMVGCVVVKDRRVIAEGYHRNFGGSHAEVNALRTAGKRARGATMYVNLEPCAHHGKTPPCVDAILAAGITTVVAATKDPNPFVSGEGFRKLRRSGVRVRVGVLRKEAEFLNEKFFTFMKSGLPFAAVKVAQTLDGRIADRWGHSKWITNERARVESHRLRSEYDAVLVGANTIKLDNPRLTVRHVKGISPVRVVVDGSLSIPVSAHVARARTTPTIILTTSKAMKDQSRKALRLSRQGVLLIPVQNNGVLSAGKMLKTLARIGISSVLIEGGSRTTGLFLHSGFIRRIYCFIAPKILGEGVDAWSLERTVSLRHSINLIHPNITLLGTDLLLEGNISSS